MSRSDVLVDADWVENHLDDPGVRWYFEAVRAAREG